MNTPEQIERLSRKEDFRAFLDGVNTLRDGELATVIGSPAPQYALGAIDAYKKVLDMAGYSEMFKRERGM